MPEYYHVRINPKRTDVMTDFSIFFTEILVTREGRWDKDSKNRIVVGDYLGFITGPVGEEVVYIYKVEREGTADERPSHWASATPYTSNNGQTAVSDRQVIILTNKHSSKNIRVAQIQIHYRFGWEVCCLGATRNSKGC